MGKNKKDRIGVANIIEGAIVGQDFSYFEWHEEEAKIVFDVYEFDKGKYELIAVGYGDREHKNCYGNGAIYVSKRDVVFFSIDDKDSKKSIEEGEGFTRIVCI